jgi:preprotein translocase subunit YajC
MLTILATAASSTGEPPAWMSFLPLRGDGADLLVPDPASADAPQKEHKAKIASLKKGDRC